MDADFKGQIHLGKKDIQSNQERLLSFQSFLDFPPPDQVVEEFDIRADVYCGIPGCGKDYFALKDKFETDPLRILSFNDIRVERYVNKYPEAKIKLTIQELYNAVWSMAKAFDVGTAPREKMKKCREENVKQICICNTNCTLKARAEVVKSLRRVFGEGINIYAHYIFTPLKDAITNDLFRDSKRIGKFVVMKFAYNQSVPTLNEGSQKYL